MECLFCGNAIEYEVTGEPFVKFKSRFWCIQCTLDLIPVIYSQSGYGDGGLIGFAFADCLKSNINRKLRRSLKQKRELFQSLLHRYKFMCVHCGETEEKKLTVDHIIPVSKRGTDDYSNLQILCKGCNSRKGAKLNHEVQHGH